MLYTQTHIDQIQVCIEDRQAGGAKQLDIQCVCVCARGHLLSSVGTFVFQGHCGDSSYGFVGPETGNEYLGEDIGFG